LALRDSCAQNALKLRLSDARIAGKLLLNTDALPVNLKDRINMANVVVTLKIMPQNPSIDLSKIEHEAKTEIVNFCSSKEFKTQIEPIAFGLKAINIFFVMDESKGSTEALENKIAQIHGVESVEVTDVRRAIG